MQGDSQKDNFLVINKFDVGWQKRLDPSSVPLGGAINSVNITLTDRGGIAPRKGELLIGEYNDGIFGVRSMHTFKLSNGSELLIKSYSDRLEYFSNKAEEWALIQDGYTSDLVFGFREDNVNPQGVDALPFGNGIDNYSEWCGYDGLLDGNVSAAATSVVVDSVLTDPIYFDGASTSSSSTTLTLATPIWANDVWVDFYVYLKSGVGSDRIGRITGNTPDTITFYPQVVGQSGAIDFEIRQLAVPDNRYYSADDIEFTAADDTIESPTADFIAAGFRVNDVIDVDGTSSNDGQYTIESLTQTVITVTGSLTDEAAGPAVITTVNAGSIVYNDQSVIYTGVPKHNTFTVGSAHAGTSGQPITVAPIEYPDAPKGNILETLNSAIYVSGSSAKPMTVFRSRLNSSNDFSFSFPRSADEGDIQWFPYGGRRISDLRAQEDSLYVISSDSVTSYEYSQDENDIAIKRPVISGPYIGTFGRSWKMDNDFAYVTPDNRVTTIGRVLRKDFRPQSIDIAYPIRLAMQQYNTNAVVGVEFQNRAYVGIKQDYDVLHNDRLLPYNKDYASWEGYWNVNAGSLASWNNKLVYGDSYTPNVYQLNVGLNKVVEGESFPMTCVWQSGFINLRGTGFYVDEISCLAVEGYITAATTINFNLYKDFATVPFQQMVITGQETQFQDNLPRFTLLGGEPLGVAPLGGAIIGGPDQDGRRHFIAFLDFNTVQCEYLSVEVGSSGLNQDWEILRLGINALEVDYENQERIKAT